MFVHQQLRVSDKHVYNVTKRNRLTIH